MGQIDELANTPIWFRGLLIVALLSGTGGSALGIMQDRGSGYNQEDAQRDFALRDERTSANRQLIDTRRDENAGQHRDYELRLRGLETRIEVHEHDTRSHVDDRLRHSNGG